MSITTGGDGAAVDDVLVTFRLPPEVVAGRAHVVGEFNEWSTTANPMDREDDAFVARIPLVPGRTYRFRYLLDDDRWENDWAADDYVPNEFGGDDSVIDLTDGASRSSEVVAPAPPPAEPDPAARPRKAPAAKKVAAKKVAAKKATVTKARKATGATGAADPTPAAGAEDVPAAATPAKKAAKRKAAVPKPAAEEENP